VLLPLQLHRPQLQNSGLTLNTDISAGLLTVPALNLLLLRPQLYEHAIPSPYNCNFLPRYPSRSFFIEPSPFPQLIFKKKLLWPHVGYKYRTTNLSFPSITNPSSPPI